MHANTFIKQLGNATEESISRLQSSLDKAMPYALGIFEYSKYEKELIEDGIYAGEDAIKKEWQKRITGLIAETQLSLPDWSLLMPKFGGRYGKHTTHLQPLLDEMSEVFKTDPTAEW